MIRVKGMELRHFRFFVVLAEELHFTRAAARLHIEQPPLSRAIKELEEELGFLLFDRDRRGTRLTASGSSFLKDARRLLFVLEQVRESARVYSQGLKGCVRIAISDGSVDRRLTTFLARFREEAPEIEIQLSEVPVAEQLRGLRSGEFKIGFALTSDVGKGIVAEPFWQDPLMVAVPARHELLVHRAIPLEKLESHPLILCDPHVCEGFCREMMRILQPLEKDPQVVTRASSLDMMLTLVGAGYGIGFATAERIASSQGAGVVVRPFALDSAVITTYLLRPSGEFLSPSLENIISEIRSK